MFSSRRSFLRLGESSDPRFEETGFNEINETVFLTLWRATERELFVGNSFKINQTCSVLYLEVSNCFVYIPYIIYGWETNKLKEAHKLNGVIIYKF